MKNSRADASATNFLPGPQELISHNYRFIDAVNDIFTFQNVDELIALLFMAARRLLIISCCANSHCEMQDIEFYIKRLPEANNRKVVRNLELITITTTEIAFT